MIQWSAQRLEQGSFLQKLLDAVPSPMFVVDGEVRIHQVNRAAAREYGDAETVHMKRGGTVLECLHASESPGGCGCSEHCDGCVVRQAATAATRGKAAVRRHAVMQLHYGGEVREMHLLITASPLDCDGEGMALVMLEDVSELVRLRSLLPICAACKKVRDDDSYWRQIEEYLHERLDVDFTHGICPDCRRQLYPKMGNRD